MNSQIERLARECGAWNQVYGNRTFIIDEHFDIDKFAKLLVNEYLTGFETEIADLKERLNLYERTN
jgi:hypothetical protein